MVDTTSIDVPCFVAVCSFRARVVERFEFFGHALGSLADLAF